MKMELLKRDSIFTKVCIRLFFKNFGRAMNTKTASYKTPNHTFSFLTWFDTYYIFCMAPIATLIFYYNFYAQSMSGLLVSYQAFADVIKAGFDISATTYYPLTFPLWGYGFLMALTNSNHVTLICIQLSLALFSVWYFIETLSRYHLFTPVYIRLFKLLITVSIPWYAFHTVRWPYSIASSLLVIAFPLLYKATQESKWLTYTILSAITFGLLLNFRSDYILMPIGLAAITWYFQPTFATYKKMILWLICIYSCLIPWSLFTHKVCGHYLVTSTNGGHVLLNGLGQYPKNKWGFICDDGCPKTHFLVDQAFGDNACTWDYRADQLLKKTFFYALYNDPLEYLKKIYFSFFEMLKVGLYQGEFFLRDTNIDLFKKSNKELLQLLYKQKIYSSNLLGVLLQRYSYFTGKYLLILSILCLSLSFFITLRKNAFFLLLSHAVVIYQLVTNILLQNLSGYSSNIIIFLLLISLYFLSFCLRKKHV